MTDAGPREEGFDVSRVLVWAVAAAVVLVVTLAAFLLPSEPAAPPPARTTTVAELTEEPGKPPPPATGLFARPVGEWLDVPAVDSTGTALRTKDLLGTCFVADFVFKSCAGTCPVLQAGLQKLQAATPGAADLRLVSITVDPARDTPEKLAEWAEILHADAARWRFLRIEEPDLRKLMRDSVKVPAPDTLLEHTNFYVLVDPDGAVRGKYEPLEHENWMQLLLADLDTLRAERSRK